MKGNDEGWARELEQGKGTAFTAALGVRLKEHDDHRLQHLVPVHATNDHDPAQDKAQVVTRYYAAIPGQEFVVKVKQVFADHGPAEYGFRVFIDEGPTPGPDSWDHFMWWGHPSSGDFKRTLTISGAYMNRESSYALTFASASEVGNDWSKPRTNRTKKRSTQTPLMGDPAIKGSPSAPLEDPPLEREKTGWIVIRMFKVARFKELEPSYQPRTKQRLQDPRSKPQLSASMGRVVVGDICGFNQEPEFDPKPLFECRIRYGECMIIRSQLARDLRTAVPPSFYRGIPLETLLKEPIVRSQCLTQMLIGTQHKMGLVGNEFAPVVSVVKHINFHFDQTAATILCTNPDRGGGLWEGAIEQFVQGDPYESQQLDSEAVHDLNVDGPSDFIPGEERKKIGLRAMFESKPGEYELCGGQGSDQLKVRQRIVDLDDD